VVSQQNADVADTLYLRDVAMATTFWLLMGYKFGCVITSGKLSDEAITHFEVLRAYIAMGIIFWLSIYGVHIGATWRIRLNRSCMGRCGLMSNYFDYLLY